MNKIERLTCELFTFSIKTDFRYENVHKVLWVLSIDSYTRVHLSQSKENRNEQRKLVGKSLYDSC